MGRRVLRHDDRAAPADHRRRLGDLDLPVVLDVDCGHPPPHLALVGGALAEVVVDGDVQVLRQTLA